MKEDLVPDRGGGVLSSYRSLFDNAAVGILETNIQGRILAVNPCFASMLGFSSPDEMMAEVPDIRALYSDPADRDRILASFTQGDQIKEFEASLRRKDGSLLWLSASARGVRDDSGALVGLEGFASDITLRKQTEAALKLEREKLEEAQAIAHVGSWEWDPSTNVVIWSEELYRIFGVDPREFETTFEGWLQFVHPDDRGLVEAATFYGGRTPFDEEYRVVLGDGRVRRLHARGYAIANHQGDLIKMVGVAQDITERYEIQESLSRSLVELRRVDADRRVLLARLSDGHEQERVRISRELHDGLGQTLASISLFAKELEEDIPARYSGRLKELRKIAEAAIVSLRSMVWNLRPIELDQLGLSAAVHRLVQESRMQSAMTVNLRVWGKQTRLFERTEIAAYRILQESITNALRHSEAQCINVELGFEEEKLLISIDDDGVGFKAPKGAHDRGRLGLANMDERARAVGGEVVVESRPGLGTSIRVWIPIEADER